MAGGKRLKRTRTISKQTAQAAAFKARKGKAAANKVLNQTSREAALARRDAVRTTQRITARAQQTAASVLDEVEEQIDTANLLDRELAKVLLDAVAFGVDMWKLQAKFQNIRINAVVAIGGPGCLAGPELEPHIAAYPGAAGLSGAEAELRDAVAEGVSECFAQWQSHVTVPGLPWYPAFAAFPGPMAPPMPNVPSPLIALPSSKMTKITTQGELRDAMTNALPDALRTAEVESGLEKLAQTLAISFTTWLASARAELVMGKGPVPTFAPPYVPVGPVINGDVISAPGPLTAAPRLAVIVPPTLV